MQIGELDSVISHSPLIAFVWELGDKDKLEFVSTNISYLGYAAEVIYRDQVRFSDLVYPDDRDKLESTLLQLIASDQDRQECSIRILNAGGGILWGHSWLTLDRDVNGKPYRVECLLQDVTSQHQSQRRCQIFAQAVDGIFMVLDPSGTVLEINEAGCRIMGQRREELLGLDWIEHFVPDDIQTELRSYVKKVAIDDELPDWSNHENDILTQDGRRLTIDWHHGVERDAGGL